MSDYPNLFGCGAGESTILRFTCDFCKTTYNEDDDGADDREYVGYTDFAGLTCCIHCFPKIEEEILGRRIGSILVWYEGILSDRRRVLGERTFALMRTRAAVAREAPLEGGTAYGRVMSVTGSRTQVELAGFLGIRQSSICDAKLRLKGGVPDSWLLVLLTKLGIDPHWVRTGEGPMYFVGVK